MKKPFRFYQASDVYQAREVDRQDIAYFSEHGHILTGYDTEVLLGDDKPEVEDFIIVNQDNPRTQVLVKKEEFFREFLVQEFMIEVPADSFGYSINNAGCLRYKQIVDRWESSTAIEPLDSGVFLDQFIHSINGDVEINGRKFVRIKK